jgi:hypothetical protein
MAWSGSGGQPSVEAARKGLYADLNHHVLLRATCRDKYAGPKSGAPQRSIWFSPRKFQGASRREIHCATAFHQGLGAASRHLADIKRFPLGIQPILEGDELSTCSRRGTSTSSRSGPKRTIAPCSPCRAANSSSLPWTSRRSSSDHRWSAGMNAHLKVRPTAVPVEVALASTSDRRKEANGTDCSRLIAAFSGRQLVPVHRRWAGPSRCRCSSCSVPIAAAAARSVI